MFVYSRNSGFSSSYGTSPSLKMLRGDLSSLRRGDGASSIRGNSLRSAWRGASASSSRGDTLRVSWRGNRGGRHRGRGQYFTTECETVPLGKLVTEFTIDLVSCSPVGVEDARITNCAYAASYSLNDDKPFKAIVPGRYIRDIWIKMFDPKD